MRIGTVVPMADGDAHDGVPEWGEILSFAQRAEAVGVDSLWVCDHMYSNAPGTEPRGVHEAWSLLTALAVATEKVELGQLVMCASFRPPAVLAKMAVTTDQISGGRLTLGLGAGWHDQEYHAFGFPLDHRVSRFEEALQIMVPLLKGETVTFEGRYHTAHEAVLLPKAKRQIPILIAGNKPRMLQLTARYADAWNTAWFWEPDQKLHDRLAAFDRALAEEGREGMSVRRTVGIEVHEADQPSATKRLADLFASYADLPIDDLLLVLLPMTVASLDRLGEAILTASKFG
jgi:alkanesulfonate monooxygenase SsuD/methylene tetrahydromethanopterin reductase-like flavin-dependent oxidoreductase (luciferase family)